MKTKFVLYSTDITCTQEYEKKGVDYIKLETPIISKACGGYRHAFACTLKQAVKQWDCLIQILKCQRFYYSMCDEKIVDSVATRFPLILFPIVYVYSIINTGKLNKIKLI
jgi:hypothetical protein